MKVDFHCHCAPYSTCAKQTIDELVKRASEASMDCISITNHDTVKDSDLFAIKCMENGIKFIPGVEIGARVYESIKGIPNYVKIHILGLNIRPSDEFENELNKFTEVNLNIKDERNKFIEEKFGIEIPYGSTKKDIRKKLVDSGAFEDEKKAKNYLNSNEIISRFQLETLNPEDAIKLIHDYGGKAILAHPFEGENHYAFNNAEVEKIIRTCIKWGLDGIEVFHYSAFKRETIEFLLDIAKNNNLIVTIGSDRHFYEDKGCYFSFENQMREQDYNKINANAILEDK